MVSFTLRGGSYQFNIGIISEVELIIVIDAPGVLFVGRLQTSPGNVIHLYECVWSM